MSAIEALRMAHVADIDLSVDADEPVPEAPSEPPPAILDTLRRRKAGAVELLRRGCESVIAPGRLRSGEPSSTSAPRPLSSKAGCRAAKPRRVPSTIVRPNG